MTRNATARKLLYDWHGGQDSAFYAAASSGLVASFLDLALEVKAMGDDGSKLLSWMQRQQGKAPYVEASDGRMYYALPWANE